MELVYHGHPSTSAKHQHLMFWLQQSYGAGRLQGELAGMGGLGGLLGDGCGQ